MTFSFENICIIYLLSVNLLGFIIMWIDKFRAKNQSWRVPESNLFLVAVIGGSIGSIAGMYVFHHKTKHLSFIIGMPAILIIQIALFVWLRFYSPFTFLIM